MRIGSIEPVYVAQEHDRVGAGGLPDARGESVIVAETDFLGGDAVILVDHGDDTKPDEAIERGGGIEIASPVLEIADGHQHLRGGDVKPRASGRPRPGSA